MSTFGDAIRHTSVTVGLQVDGRTRLDAVSVVDLPSAIDDALASEGRLPSPVKVYEVAERMVLYLVREGKARR